MTLTYNSFGRKSVQRKRTKQPFNGCLILFIYSLSTGSDKEPELLHFSSIKNAGIPAFTGYLSVRSRTVTLSTCVENTKIMQNLKKLKKYHLHMCGEYLDSMDTYFRSLGAPPHVWRIPFHNFLRVFFSRITSTCVENTYL